MEIQGIIDLYPPEVEDTDVVDLDNVRPTVIKFIEVVPARGIPSDSSSNQIKCLPLYQPATDVGDRDFNIVNL